MKKFRRLIFTVLISLTFGVFVACDADQESKADDVVSDKPASTDTATAPNTEGQPEVLDGSIAGKYVDPKNPESYLVLNADGTYLMTNNRRHANDGKPYSGTFSMEGDQIRLELTAKQSTMLQFKDGAIVGRTGIRWEKQ